MIADRKQLAKQLIKEGDVVAELGVDWGWYSEYILTNTECRVLYSIDRWAGDRGHDAKQEADAREHLGLHGDRSIVMKATFSEALAEFEDGFFDFVYIDGYAHTGQENGKTLRTWWEKVKPGGILAGHDYSPKWPKTKNQVDRFIAEFGLDLKVTKDESEYPSWWVVK